MNEKKYKHSFARRLTRWIMLVLFIMMGTLAYCVYEVAKSFVVHNSAQSFHSSMQSSVLSINAVMSDVCVAVRNNIFDVERHLDQPDEMQVIMERIVSENPRVRSCGISFIENYYPNKGRSYCPYAMHNDSMQVVGMPMGGSDYDYLKKEWFLEAVAADSAYWSKAFFDGHESKTPLVAYMYPIHDRQGRVVAILGADLSLDFMTRLLQKQDSIFQKDTWSIDISGDGVFNSYVLTSDGTYLTHPEKQCLCSYQGCR